MGMDLNNTTKVKKWVSVNNWTNKTKQLGQQRACIRWTTWPLLCIIIIIIFFNRIFSHIFFSVFLFFFSFYDFFFLLKKKNLFIFPRVYLTTRSPPKLHLSLSLSLSLNLSLIINIYIYSNYSNHTTCTNQCITTKFHTLLIRVATKHPYVSCWI